MQKKSSALGFPFNCFLVSLVVAVAVATGSMWPQGHFVAIGDRGLYQLPLPVPTVGLAIRRVDRVYQGNLTAGSSATGLRSLKITIGPTVYQVVLGQSALVLYQNDPKKGLPVFKFELRFTDFVSDSSYRPRGLLQSASLEEAFFLLSENHLPVRLMIDTYVDELYESPPGVRESPATISTVTQAYTASYRDDVYTMVVNDNNIKLFSVLGDDYKRTVDFGEYCDQITALYELPPLADNGTISFVMDCTKDGNHAQYHIVSSYVSVEAPQVHRLATPRVPYGTSTHLVTLHSNGVTVYDRSHLSDGVPQDYPTTGIRQLALWEVNDKSFLFVFAADQNVTVIDLGEYFLTLNGVSTIPNTLQPSDPSYLPTAILDDGLLLTVLGENGFDIVVLTNEGSTMVEVARVTRIPEPPAFVTFIADPNQPTVPTTIATEVPTPTVSVVTDPPTEDPNTAPVSPVTTPPPGHHSNELDTTALGASLGTVLVALALTGCVAAVVGVTCYCQKKPEHKPKQNSIVELESGVGKSTMVNGSEMKPTEETTAMSGQIDTSVEASSESGQGAMVSNPPPPPQQVSLPDITVTAVMEENGPVNANQTDDQGYNSDMQSQAGGLSVDGRDVASRQSQSSLGTLSIVTNDSM